MRKLLSVLSLTCVLLAVSVVQSHAKHYLVPPTTYNGYTISGDFNLDKAARTMTFVGTVTDPAGEVYDITAEGDISGQAPRLTLSGSITVSQGDTIIKQILINRTSNTEWGAVKEFIDKLLAALPQ